MTVHDEHLPNPPSQSQQRDGESAAPAASSPKRPSPRTSSADAPASAPVAMADSAVAPPPAGEAAEPLPLAKEYASRGEPSEPPTALPWLIGGVCAGLLGVAVLAMILFGFGRRERTPVAGIAAGANQHAGGGQDSNEASQAEKRQRDARLREENRPRNNASGGNTSGGVIAPNSHSPDILTWDRDPNIETGGDLLKVDDLNNPTAAGGVPDDSPPTINPAGDGDDPPAAPVARLASLPKAVALAPRAASGLPSSTGGPVMLTRIDIDDARDVQLQLLGNHLAGGTGRFELKPTDDGDTEGFRTWDVRHVSDDNPAAAVGQYTLADGELSFEWSPGADEARYGQLVNEPLRITAGEETATIAQRIAEEVAPLSVRVDAGAVAASVPVVNPPEDADLIVSIDELGEAFGEHTWEPGSAIEVGKASYLRFGGEDDTFQFALQVTAERVGPSKVRVESRPMFRQGNTKKWDYFRPAKMAQLLVAMQQQQVLMDAQLREVQRRYRRDQAARDRATAIHNQQSAALLENIANLERISDRCQELQADGQLHFRVYAENGDEQIDLVRTVANETDGPSKQDPVDENIGPPIDPNVGPPAADDLSGTDNSPGAE